VVIHRLKIVQKNYLRDPAKGAYSAPPDSLADGEGARSPKNLTLSRPFGPRFTICHHLEKNPAGAHALTLTSTLYLLNPKSVICESVEDYYCVKFQVISIRDTHPDNHSPHPPTYHIPTYAHTPWQANHIIDTAVLRSSDVNKTKFLRPRPSLHLPHLLFTGWSKGSNPATPPPQLGPSRRRILHGLVGIDKYIA